MMRKILFVGLFGVVSAAAVWGQCTTTNITGNLSPANGDTLSGIYNITGNFTIGPGITVHVRPFSQNSCGSLEIYAGGNIFIAGTINANGAGNVGGAAGAAGLANNINNIEQCSAPTDQCADIFPFGGGAGGNAFGSGAGFGGIVGQNGSGRKDRCLNFGDEGGRVGGAGGAGAGAGGTYGVQTLPECQNGSGAHHVHLRCWLYFDCDRCRNWQRRRFGRNRFWYCKWPRHRLGCGWRWRRRGRTRQNGRRTGGAEGCPQPFALRSLKRWRISRKKQRLGGWIQQGAEPPFPGLAVKIPDETKQLIS